MVVTVNLWGLAQISLLKISMPCWPHCPTAVYCGPEVLGSQRLQHHHLQVISYQHDLFLASIALPPMLSNLSEQSIPRFMCRGGFLKRDGRPREPETLTSRLVDRPIRPLLPSGWNYETQVLQWVLSYDPDNSPQPHAVTAAAASLLISDIPFTRAVASVRVGMVDGAFVVNPTAIEMEQSTVDVVIAGTESAILMIEGFADFVSEDTLLEALEVGHTAISEICVQMTVCLLSPCQALNLCITSCTVDRLQAWLITLSLALGMSLTYCSG